jgi:hypothetical protein
MDIFYARMHLVTDPVQFNCSAATAEASSTNVGSRTPIFFSAEWSGGAKCGTSGLRGPPDTAPFLKRLPSVGACREVAAGTPKPAGSRASEPFAFGFRAVKNEIPGAYGKP